MSARMEPTIMPVGPAPLPWLSTAKGSSGAVPVMSPLRRAVGVALAALSPRGDATPVAGWQSGS